MVLRCFRRCSDGRLLLGRRQFDPNKHPKSHRPLQPCPSSLPIASPPFCRIRSRATTYTRELGAAVTALGGSAALLDVQNSEVTAGSLDDSGPVGASVVAAEISLVSIRRKHRPRGKNTSTRIRFAFP